MCKIAFTSAALALTLSAGLALAAPAPKAKGDDAIARLRRAVAAEPNNPRAHNDLGLALRDAGRPAEACFRKAIALDPKSPQWHDNLGVALAALGKINEAVLCFREAIRLSPALPGPYLHLGQVLSAQGRLDEAVACFRKAIELDPKNADAHTHLGVAMHQQRRLEEAIACYRKALQLDPRRPLPFIYLGRALLQKGRRAEAEACFRRVLALLPPQHSLRPGVARQLRECRLPALEAKLPDVLSGKLRPSPADRLDYAHLCQRKKLYAAATRLATEAFAEAPKLADDLAEGHRYEAACWASRAASGQDKDAKLDDKASGKLRRQALTWLRADLALLSKRLREGTPAERAHAQTLLRLWQSAPALAGVRDKDAVSGLPEAERASWRKLWAEVAALPGKER